MFINIQPAAWVKISPQVCEGQQPRWKQIPLQRLPWTGVSNEAFNDAQPQPRFQRHCFPPGWCCHMSLLVKTNSPNSRRPDLAMLRSSSAQDYIRLMQDKAPLGWLLQERYLDFSHKACAPWFLNIRLKKKQFRLFREADEVTAYPARLRNKGAAPKQSSHPGGFEPKRVCRGLGQRQWVPDFRLYCLVLPTKGTDPMAQVTHGLHHDHDFCRFKCRDRCILSLGQQLWLRGWQVRNQGAFISCGLGATELWWSGEYVPICFQHACESLFVNMVLRPSRNLCIERCVQRSPQCPVSIPRPWGNTAIESARADKDFLCQQVDCSSVFGLLNHGNHEIHEPRETMGNWETMATEALTSPVSPRSGTRGF